VPNDVIFGHRHRHGDSFQVVKVLEGRGEVVIGKERFAADAGGVFWVPPYTWHESIDPVPSSPRMLDMRIARVASNPGPVPLRRMPYHIPTDHEPAVLVCFHEIVKEYARRRPYWEWTISTLINQFILLLARALETSAALQQASRVAGYRVDTAGVEKALNFIHQNYFQSIDLKQLAGVAGMSVSRFSKLFSAVVGTTPIDYLIDFRLKRASEMIAEERFTLTQIAAAVGFSSIHHFSRCYKQRLGQPPSFRHGTGGT
jgi:AraC-like DNA-binding protein